jgi:hypothetical protein
MARDSPEMPLVRIGDNPSTWIGWVDTATILSQIARNTHSVWAEGLAVRVHAKGTNVVRLRVHNPNLHFWGGKRLFVLAEEEVVGSVRHERLIAHIGGGGATVVGGRSPFGV